MAYYAALVSLVQLLEDIVHRNRYQNLLLDIQQQMAYVYEKFNILQTLLDDYSPQEREEADVLEKRIRDAAYQAQDIIESHISDQIHPKAKTIIHGVKRVLQHLISLLQMAIIGRDNQGLEKVKELVDSTVEELLRIKTTQKTEDLPLNYHSTDAGTSKLAHSHADTMEGVEEHLTMIKEQLCGEPSNLRVVSIVGMGGIGKTTLAKNIYYDSHMMYHFDCRAWVTVSQNYRFKKVLLDILDFLNVPIDKSIEVVKLGVEIYKHLKERKYLIIIDDIWETKIWDEIKNIFPDDSNGSRIIITTRISNVASYACTFGFSHHMQILSADQSWNLFCKKVFCPPELEDIGRLIAKNCHGLPLAIVVVAGLLSKVQKKRSDWEEIARNVSLAAVENDEHFSKILSLSYNNLPHQLKPLFLYIGGFSEDYEIPVSKLVKLWIAEGLLKPIESKSLEEVAEEYLEDLVKRNLVLITKKTFNGKIKCCGIHDILRDLCLEIASHENFLHVVDIHDYIWPTTACNVRRIYVPTHRKGFRPFRLFPKEEECGSHVRSVIHLNFNLNFLPSVLCFRLLRVLDATRRLLSAFPTEILKLFLLRYLALWGNILPIPPSISKLQNLQTLILVSFRHSGLPRSLPSQIREMPNLRHIMVHGQNLSSLSKERNVGEPCILENLQTLSLLVDVTFTNKVIEMIPNLKKLKVKYYADRSSWQVFHLKNLFHLHQLKTLSILFLSAFDILPFPRRFAFPLGLNKLCLEGCKIPWRDMMVVSFLPNLQVLKLRNSSFVGEKWESTEGGFPQLRFLLLQSLDIKYWQAENTHFPRLQCLKISYCEKLEEIPCEIGDISTLELVEVESSELAAKSAMKMQEEQQEIGNYVLQVRVYSQDLNFSDCLSSLSLEEEFSLEEEILESEEEIQES